MNVVFSGARLRTLSLTQLRWLCTTGVLMLSICGTVATVVLFNQAQDLSMFSGTLLAIAVLFRFPDWTKFGVYALNYAILYTFLYSRGITNPVLLQNPMFVLFMIVLFDRVTFFSMSSNYFKSRRLQQLNEWMVQEDRNKSEMISIAIHDLKSPVTGIMSVSKLLRDNPGGFAPGERDEILSEIQESSRAILGRIEDLVDIAQSGAGTVLHYESFNLLEVLYGTIQNFNYQASLKRIEVYTRFPEGPLIVRADRRAVIRIFENLVSNAIKYSPPDGSVLLQSRSTAGAGRVMVDVCDEGPGFTLEDRSRIFGRFTRLSARPTAGESSTGIGLFTVYKLVQQMENVTLELDSESGAGARFSVTLPLA
jgi:signal transduction histidine kinase